MARRMAWIAIKQKVHHRQRLGALPLRSATDLATVLIYDVEEVCARGIEASMLIQDVRGGFDAVLRGRGYQSVSGTMMAYQCDPMGG